MAAVLQHYTHVLVCLSGVPANMEEQLATLKDEFFGHVVDSVPEGGLRARDFLPGAIFFVAGDVRAILRRPNDISVDNLRLIRPFRPSDVVFPRMIEEVELGELPRTVYGVGVYFPGLFNTSAHDFYDELHAAHEYQELTESNKAGVSYRKDRYLSRVTAEDKGDLKYHLLRCSTNFQVPTENFRAVDELIVGKAQEAAKLAFGNSAAELNHVLAQVYHNTAATPLSASAKEAKARIKSHSDKTKDMPLDGIMAFCTFYSPDIADKAKISPDGNYMYKNGSVLTTLRWTLKASVNPGEGYKESFSVLLHPNSLLLVPLSTNRLYTHEIVPPQLPVDKIPTRLGYVVRCSKTLAVSRDGETLVNGEPLVRPTNEQLEELRRLYREENCSTEVVRYEDVSFSMNSGDYLPPVL